MQCLTSIRYRQCYNATNLSSLSGLFLVFLTVVIIFVFTERKSRVEVQRGQPVGQQRSGDEPMLPSNVQLTHPPFSRMTFLSQSFRYMGFTAGFTLGCCSSVSESSGIKSGRIMLKKSRQVYLYNSTMAIHSALQKQETHFPKRLKGYNNRPLYK